MSRKRRRTKGEGTGAYRLPDGRWRAEINLGTDGNGKRRRKIIYGRTRAEVDTQLRNELGQRDAGIMQAGKSPTLIAWLDHWLENIASANLKPRTALTYRSYINTWVRNTVQARKQLSKIRADDLESIYRKLRDVGRSETTVSQLHRILSRALKIARMRGLTAVNVAENVTAPQPSSFSPNLLSMDDAQLLLASLSGTPNEARWITALALGLRQGEVLGMGWDQVDLDERTLRVTRSLYRLPWSHGCPDASCGRPAWRCPNRTGGGVFVGEPKSKAAIRAIPLPTPLVEALTMLRKTQEMWRLEEGDRWTGFTDGSGQSVDLVFSTRTGGARNSQDDWTEWRKLLADTGIAPVRLHDARHTAATVLLAMGVQSRVVMTMMGWSTVSMTTRYQHVVDDMLQDASRRVEGALWSKPQRPTPEPRGTVIDLASRRASRERHGTS